jgi:amino acid adenylation domain-containing protein
MIGMAVANRDQVECEDLIGYLTNLLVLRTDVSGTPTFRELIGSMRETCLDAYANDVPFEKLVENLQPERKHSGNPLTDVQVSFVPLRPPLEMRGLSCRPAGLEAPTHTGQPITLYVTDGADGSGSGTRFDLLYHSDLFTSAQMAALADQLVHLLEAATAAPDTPAGRISLVTPAARRVLPDLSGRLDRPPYQPVPEMFRAWAERAPGRVAIRHGGREMSYGELRERAEAVSGHLLAAAARPGDRVAVGGEPSPGLMAAFLGALMARAVVVPLDRRLPLQRQRQVLEIGGAARLLWAGTPSETAPVLAELPGLAATCVEAATGRLPGHPAGSPVPLPTVGRADPSYIYFTSGSTGIPKGVLGRHDTWSHLLTWQRERFRFGPGDRSAMTTRLSFDMVLRDLFLPLTSGATLCLPDEDLVLDVGRALRYLQEERVTVLHLVPALGQRWLDHRPGDVLLPDLRWTFFGGEPLPDALVQRWLAAFPGEQHRVVNFYGTTETMVRTALEVPSPPLPGIQPVGPPLPHTQTVVLNPAGEAAGIGELGEIFLRSRFCTYGYINAPEEQAARFLPNRHRPEGDDVCYRTGDSGRHRPDGIVDVLGRRDDQVKIHGVRIDPAEVQAVLAMHPDVAEAGIKVHPGRDGEAMLVAYYVGGGADGASGPQLRTWLAERLPEAMVPRAFTRLDKLPLLPNGKLDKRSLPEPDLHVDTADDAEPSTDTERAVARIWGDVLGLPAVGLRSNFFALGGHSLKVVDLVSRIRESFAVDLPLRVAYESPTVEETARAIEQWQRDELGRVTTALPEEGDEVDALLRALDELEGGHR